MRGSLSMIVAATIVIAAVPVGWWTTDALEANDDFCNACHLPGGEPLHIPIREDFDRQPASSLAARHAAAEVRTRPDAPDFRCIDCHGGVGLIGRARVKLLSIKDSALYLAGRYDEPDRMTWPLWDADCQQCHPGFRAKGRGFDGEAFHDRPGHNVDLGMPCVDCHSAHATDARADLWYLRPESVRTRCAECHVEYQTN